MHRGARRIASLALALGLGGCLHSYADQAQDVKSRLIGLHPRSLRSCIGSPMDIRVDGESEYLTYRWILDQRLEPRRETTEEEMQDLREPASPLHRHGARNGTCELVFELREGRVSGVEADGRTAEGLNWNAGCTLLARRCLPPE